MIAEASPREGLSLDELAELLAAAGNRVVRVDRDRNVVVVAHHVEEY